MSLIRNLVDEKHTLNDMALLVRRAGLEHLVLDPTPEEVLALAYAGDQLALERVACFVKAFSMPPGQVLKQFDGGATLRAETKALAYALSSKQDMPST